MAEPTHASRRGARPVGLRSLLVLGAVFLLSTLVVGPLRAGAQEPPDPSDATSSPTSEAPETTTTLPSGGELGNILPRPNSGREPETPGDPGGSQQVMLFFALTAAIVGITVFVFWRSRVLRTRRAAEGHDPVAMARRSGGDVRKPRPPGIVD